MARRLYFIIGVLICTGCSITTKRDAEYYVEWGTKISIGQRAPDEPSEARADLLPWLQMLIQKEQEQKHKGNDDAAGKG